MKVGDELHRDDDVEAKFILGIETGGVFQRLQSHKFWETNNCILISLAGVPARSTRRFIRKLSDDCKIPVYAFVDCDSYGISNIARTSRWVRATPPTCRSFPVSRRRDFSV